MLAWIATTLFLAFPFLVPLCILIYIKRPRFSYGWPGQKGAVLIFYAFYFLALMAFAAHTYALKAAVPEFFAAYYGSPLAMTIWCQVGYGAQFFSVVALLFAVNWRVVDLFSRKRRKAALAKAALRQVKEQTKASREKVE